MIVVMEKGAAEKEIQEVIERLSAAKLESFRFNGKVHTTIEVVGEIKGFDLRNIRIMKGVRDVVLSREPYSLACRTFENANTVVEINGVKIGGKEIVLIAGPCAVEDERQMFKTAQEVWKSGAQILRGGAYKPRTSPYSFQGLGDKGLELLRKAADTYGLLVVTEAMEIGKIKLVAQFADIIQVGARNMHNYALLKQVGKTKKPVLLKRAFNATLEEWLLSAEYILSEGNPNVILCERGIRTFEKNTRYTLDLSAIPVLRELTHLPLIVDPSHSCEFRDYVVPLARAAVATGADGIMVEVHYRPQNALSDGAQSLIPQEYHKMIRSCRKIALASGRSFPRERKKY